MTQIEINTAIAAFCGDQYHKPTPEEVASGCYSQYEPKFTRNLDLIHNATLRLVQNPHSKQRSEFFSNLKLAWYKDHNAPEPWEQDEEMFYLCNASSELRCEALLRTIGKWKD